MFADVIDDLFRKVNAILLGFVDDDFFTCFKIRYFDFGRKSPDQSIP